MDHGHYPFSALPTRPRLTWPGGARLAAFVLLHLEHWELRAPAPALRDPRFVGEFGSFEPDYRSWTQREYGNRIGVFRVLDLLDAAGIVPAVAASAMAVDRNPRLVSMLKARGCEFIAHGMAAGRMISSRMTEHEEREFIATAIDTLERATGVRPRGWCGQDHGESAHTPQRLADAGIEYVLDWPNDEQPYWMSTQPRLLAVPTQPEWDDVEAQWLRRVPVTRYPALVNEAFSTLHAEGEVSGRTFCLAVHPWLSGMASRVRYLRETIEAIRRHPGVWWTQPGQISAHLHALGDGASLPPRGAAGNG